MRLRPFSLARMISPGRSDLCIVVASLVRTGGRYHGLWPWILADVLRERATAQHLVETLWALPNPLESKSGLVILCPYYLKVSKC